MLERWTCLEPIEAPKESFVTPEAVAIILNHGAARTYMGSGRFASYKDKEQGIYLIGYKSKEMRGRPVGLSTRATEQEIEEQLIKDLIELEKYVNHYLIMPLNKNKKAAVLCYAHDIGLPNFKECKLLQLLNEKASKKKIIKEWSPYINPFYKNKQESLINRRRVELNLFLGPDKEVPLFTKHDCQLKQCLLNLAETELINPNQIKAIEYLEKKIVEWDPEGTVMKNFWRCWNSRPGNTGSPRNL